MRNVCITFVMHNNCAENYMKDVLSDIIKVLKVMVDSEYIM